MEIGSQIIGRKANQSAEIRHSLLPQETQFQFGGVSLESEALKIDYIKAIKKLLSRIEQNVLPEPNVIRIGELNGIGIRIVDYLVAYSMRSNKPRSKYETDWKQDYILFGDFLNWVLTNEPLADGTTAQRLIERILNPKQRKELIEAVFNNASSMDQIIRRNNRPVRKEVLESYFHMLAQRNYLLDIETYLDQYLFSNKLPGEIKELPSIIKLD